MLRVVFICLKIFGGKGGFVNQSTASQMISAAADDKNAATFIKNAILQRILLKNRMLNAADVSEITNATIVVGMAISSIPRAESATLISMSDITPSAKYSAETTMEIMGIILFTIAD